MLQPQFLDIRALPTWRQTSKPQPRLVDKVDHSDDPDYEVFLQEYEEEQARKQLARTSPSMRFVDLSTIRTKPSKLPAGKRICGYAVAWDEVIGPISDTRWHPKPYYEQFKRGAFARVLSCGLNVRAHISHKPHLKVASTDEGNLELSEDARGLYFRMVPRDDHAGQLALIGIQLGRYRGMSPRWTNTVSTTKWGSYNGKPLALITDCELREISLTPSPMYRTTCVV